MTNGDNLRMPNADRLRSADAIVDAFARLRRTTSAIRSTATEPNQSDIDRHLDVAAAGASSRRPAKLNPRELGQALEGQQLDHVLLEQFVGGGGMGAVFRAWDTDLHRTVAVKVLSAAQASDAESQRRFQTEARSAARLDHPNIARVHYVGEDRGVRYIVFEYIDGTNVRDLVYANGPLPLADALSYTLQIAGALTHAWEREVVHRDIKPSNILITHDGLAKLVDMGLARLESLDQSRARRNGDRRHARHVRLHFARAGPQPARRRHPQRHLFARLHAVLHAHRPAAVSRGHGAAEAARRIKASRRRTCASCGRMCPICWPTCWRRCWPSGRRIASRIRPSCRPHWPSCIDQLGLAPPQVALPAYWSNVDAAPTWLATPRTVAGACRAAARDRAGSGDQVASRGRAACVLRIANLHGRRTRQADGESRRQESLGSQAR